MSVAEKIFKKGSCLASKVWHVQFARYFFVGCIATLIDWVAFYISTYKLLLHYIPSLMIAFVFGSATNYILNRALTFDYKTKKIGMQFGLFIIISAISLILSMGLMYFLIDILWSPKMISRMITSVIMLFINYTLHRSFTFNKKFLR